VSNTFNIADLSPFFGPEGSESRSTLSQEGEDDEDINHVLNKPQCLQGSIDSSESAMTTT
jgi:hypothetical protein